MKKKIAVLLIAIMLAMCFSSIITVAIADTGSMGDIEIEASDDESNFNKAWKKGMVDTHGEEENDNVSIQPGGRTIISPLRLLGRVILMIPQVANSFLAVIMGEGTFTIRNTLCNKYDLFNIKYLVDPDSTPSDSPLKGITENVAPWYIGIRNLSAVIIVIMLIYIGIRMALATVAQEKAQYKKMLFAWLEGVALLFVLHYIIIISIYLTDWLVNRLAAILSTVETSGSIEKTILTNINAKMFKTSSNWGWLFYGILYILLTFSEIQVFIFYLSRLIKIAYLIIIAPLVCATYSLDKLKDSRAQAFENWTKEFAIVVLAQPLQLVIYIVFIGSAGEILSRNWVLAIIFFILIPYGSRIFKSVLKFGEKSKDFENAGKFKDRFMK